MMPNVSKGFLLFFGSCFVIIVFLFASPSIRNDARALFSRQDTEASGASVQHWRIPIDDRMLNVEVVSTPEAIKQGLSGREPLKEDEGMLFVFSEPDDYSFWMKGMRFPLDILWLRNGRVVDIAHGMQPPNSPLNWPETYHPKAEADMVLELTAGGAMDYGLTIGSEIGIEQARR